jgi:hypothetical protein
MSYTSAEQVSSHLAAKSMPAAPVFDLPVPIDSNESIRFSPVATESGSVVVKVPRARVHTRATLILTNPLDFASVPVVPNSVVVASDSSLGQIFLEPVDYLINARDGRLTLRSGSTLTPGSSVTIWYLPYTVLQESDDYHLDPDASTIRRAPSGNIALTETIFLDFIPQTAHILDEMIQSAVSAANGLIERMVDPDSQFEADPVLGLAATYTALEIVCRSAAARELTFRTGEDRPARTWMQLAGDYASRAESLITGFRPPVTPLSHPTIS